MTPVVRTRVAVLSSAGMWVTVVRTAPPPYRSAVTEPFADVHVCADPDRREDVRWHEYADVLGGSRPLPARWAERRVADVLDRHPGCLVAAVPRADGGCVAGVRDGRLLVALPVGGAALSVRRWSAFASLLHSWLVAGHSVDVLRTVVLDGGAGRAGAGRGAARVRVVRL
ncbi:hypothetical protein [Streptomyces megasporus]|uniref:hypothetical protein n=1 Tax=Streptomyces megasporus TaxID=44060 RepID=UPI00068D2B71|nr:hypothetical protein [Streptomyces megasporus]